MSIIQRLNRRITIRYIYVLFITNPRYWYRAKIGISNDVKRRIKEIRDSIYSETRKEESVRCLVKIPFLFSERFEGKLHRLTSRLSAQMPGNGRTEWRWYLNPITALLIGYFGRELQMKNGEALRFLFFVLIPLPLDIALLVIVTFLVELSLVCGGVFLLYYILKIW